MIKYNKDKRQWESPDHKEIAGKPLTEIYYGSQFVTNKGNKHTVCALEECGQRIRIYVNDGAIYGPAYRNCCYFYEGAIASWCENPCTGMNAKHKDWTWGGKIIGVSPMGHAYIHVGNNETGESYPVLPEDIEIIHQKPLVLQ